MGKQKKPKKTRTSERYKLIFMPPADKLSKEQENDMEIGGMFLEKDDVKIIYHALGAYKPVKNEEHRHSLLLESFEEILVCDYGEPYPDEK